MLELAQKYFKDIADKAGLVIDNVWFEPKMGIYYCRTKNGEFWQIPETDLRTEAKLLGWTLPQ